MPDISVLTLPSGAQLDIKDNAAREAIQNIQQFRYFIADMAEKTPDVVTGGSLVPTSETMGIIYLVRDTTGLGESTDIYDEYITVSREISDEMTTYSWEKIGSTRIDLSPYLTIEDAGNIYATKTDTVLNTSLSRGRKVNSEIGYGSFAFGASVSATEHYAHAEGFETTASGQGSHAEGASGIASGDAAHAEGSQTKAMGMSSHAEGVQTTAGGAISHAEGWGTKASGNIQSVIGMYNTGSDAKVWSPDITYDKGDYVSAITLDGSEYFSGRYIYKSLIDLNLNNSIDDPNCWELVNLYGINSKNVFEVGNGVDDDNRSNALSLTWEGDLDVARSMSIGGVPIFDPKLFAAGKYEPGNTALYDHAEGEYFIWKNKILKTRILGIKAGDNISRLTSGSKDSGTLTPRTPTSTVIIDPDGDRTNNTDILTLLYGFYNMYDAYDKYDGSGNTTYYRGDVVRYDGKFYVCNGLSRFTTVADDLLINRVNVSAMYGDISDPTIVTGYKSSFYNPRNTEYVPDNEDSPNLTYWYRFATYRDLSEFYRPIFIDYSFPDSMTSYSHVCAEVTGMHICKIFTDYNRSPINWTTGDTDGISFAPNIKFECSSGLPSSMSCMFYVPKSAKCYT